MTVPHLPAPSTFAPRRDRNALAATRLVVLSILSTALALGCNDSESSPGTGGTGGANGTAGTGGGAPRSTAFLATQRIFTQDGRFVAAQVVSQLDGQELDASQSLELSGFSRTYVFNGKLFVFDGETLQVTRYAIDDDLQLTEDGRFSMMGVGITRFAPTTVFINPTRAIYVGDEEIAVVFNPEAMVITSTFDIPGLAKEGLSARFNAPIRVGDNLYMATAWWNGDTFEVHPAVAVAVLQRPCLALDHGVNRLQMAGIRDHADVRDTTVVEDVIGFVTDVVLHVAGPARHPGPEVLLETREDLFRRHVQNGVQNRQSPAVRRPDDKLVDSVPMGAVNQEMQTWNDRLRPLQRKPLLPHERLAQHVLQRLRPQQVLQDDASLARTQNRPVPRGLHLVDEPTSDTLVLNV